MKRLLASVTAVLIVGALLVGCGGKSGGTGRSVVNQPSSPDEMKQRMWAAKAKYGEENAPLPVKGKQAPASPGPQKGNGG